MSKWSWEVFEFSRDSFFFFVKCASRRAIEFHFRVQGPKRRQEPRVSCRRIASIQSTLSRFLTCRSPSFFPSYTRVPRGEFATKVLGKSYRITTPAQRKHPVQLYAHVVHINRRPSRFSRGGCHPWLSYAFPSPYPLVLPQRETFPIKRGEEHPSGWTPPRKKTSKFRYTAHEFSPLGVKRWHACRDESAKGPFARALIRQLTMAQLRIYCANARVWARCLSQMELVNRATKAVRLERRNLERRKKSNARENARIDCALRLLI